MLGGRAHGAFRAWASPVLWQRSRVTLQQRCARQLGSLAQQPRYDRLQSAGGPATALRRAASSNVAALEVVASPFSEAHGQVALSERQEALLLERLPRDWDEGDVYSALRGGGVDLGEDWQGRILMMRSRLGRFFGRALVAYEQSVPQARAAFPQGAVCRPVDRYDVEAFVEQCERFVRLSEDLRRLARPEHFLRTITITGVPEGYGRRDIVNVVRATCGVEVPATDVVFRFKRWGRQSDTCYVICPSEQQADRCVSKIQELAVPKRAAYGTLFGAAFLWSSRGSLFLSNEALDFLIHDAKSWVFTTGWQEDMGTDEFAALVGQMQLRPVRVEKIHVEADSSSGFFVLFSDTDRAKRAIVKLRRLQHRWRIKRETPFVAYPRRVDIHREDEARYEDEDSAEDSDLEEPVHY